MTSSSTPPHLAPARQLCAGLFAALLLALGFLALAEAGAFPSCACGGCRGLIPGLARQVRERFVQRRGQGAESAAIGSLRAISSAQSVFREADRDRDGVLDYAHLAELGRAELIDEVLATGVKQGYRFSSAPGPAPQFTWWAFAEPTRPGCTGDRAF